MLMMRKIIIKACNEIGFTDITEASDGTVAWQALQEANPPHDLIITDLTMPIADGIDLLRRMRTDSRFKSIPLVLMVTEAELNDVAESVIEEANAVITKPFTRETLREKLETVYKNLSKVP